MTTAVRRRCPYCGSGNISSLQKVRGWHCANCEQSFASHLIHAPRSDVALAGESRGDARWMVFMLPWFFIMMVAGIASLGFFNWQPSSHILPEGTEAEMRLTEEINRLRVEKGLQPLTASADLSLIAREHSRDMATRKFKESVTPDGIGPQHRVEAAGLQYACAENIFVHDEGFSQASKYIVKESVDSWKTSSVSMGNALGDYTLAGSGVTWSRRTCGLPGTPCYSVFVTTLFCKPTVS